MNEFPWMRAHWIYLELVFWFVASARLRDRWGARFGNSSTFSRIAYEQTPQNFFPCNIYSLYELSNCRCGLFRLFPLFIQHYHVLILLIDKYTIFEIFRSIDIIIIQMWHRLYLYVFSDNLFENSYLRGKKYVKAYLWDVVGSNKFPITFHTLDKVN